MENRAKGGYVTFGVPYKQGEKPEGTTFAPFDENGREIPYQEKPIAFYPDGSTKWSSFTARVDGDGVEIKKAEKKEYGGITVNETDDGITVDNGAFTAIFPKSGTTLMKTPYADAILKVQKETYDRQDGDEIKRIISYYGEIETAEVEEEGALKTTVKLTGTHRSAHGDTFLRYIIRFTLFYDEKSVNVKHTFIFDGDESTDFIKGIALVMKRKMTGKLYNRRIKMTGDYGVMHECMQILNLWRPRLGPSIGIQPVHSAQLRGEMIDLAPLVDLRNGNPVTEEQIDNVTKWDCYRLQQLTPDSFEVRKRTGHDECTFIKANWGKRSKGLMYIADEKGGVSVCLRNFWQKYPSSLHAEGLCSDEGMLMAWIVSPDGLSRDMRHYDVVSHDQTYYEGTPEIGSSAYGIANTNDLTVYFYDEVASDELILSHADRVQKPPVMICSPEYYHETRVLGYWSLPDRSTPLKKWAEDEMDKAFNYYKNEIEQRRWYGLWDYGDIMHTYDAQRHCWKYDLGGYAWQSTELVPTLWLWYSFLRTGREDMFSVAEAMSRHSADVDIYHMGPLKGLGSRHNVVHWGDSCKEARIGMAGHHRALYYLTGGDLRIGDCMKDVVDADFATVDMDPLRYYYMGQKSTLPTHARTGPDWSTYCSNWMTEWERTNNTKWRDKIMTGINDLKKAPLRLISGSNFEYDPATGHLGYIGESAAGGSHLAICMGGPETWTELVPLLGDEEFNDMLVQYGSFYFLTPEEKRRATNNLIDGEGFEYPYMAAALCAYAAKEKQDKDLAHKVWQVLVYSLAGKNKKDNFDDAIVENYFNAKELHEMFWISTNFAAQWCLNTIVALEHTAFAMPETLDELEWEDWVK